MPRLLVTPRRALTCIAAGAAYPLAFVVGYTVVVRYLRRIP
jgi:hypothetical protein